MWRKRIKEKSVGGGLESHARDTHEMRTRLGQGQRGRNDARESPTARKWVHLKRWQEVTLELRVQLAQPDLLGWPTRAAGGGAGVEEGCRGRGGGVLRV